MNNNIITNINDVENMLKEAQKRSKVRNITIEDMTEALERITDRLLILSTKKDAIGTKVQIDINNQSFPAAYRRAGTPESTHFEAIYKATGWKVLRIYRSACWPKSTMATIQYTDATKEHMIDRLKYFND